MAGVEKKSKVKRRLHDRRRRERIGGTFESKTLHLKDKAVFLRCASGLAFTGVERKIGEPCSNFSSYLFRSQSKL